jgi:serine/threonine protein kinase
MNPALEIGKTFGGGRYVVERVLGIGGFGITYYVRHVELGTHYAVKEFFISGKCVRENDRSTVLLQNIDQSRYAKLKKRFADEARTLVALNNPHVVRVIDIFEENNTSYIVMEFVPGITLQQKVDRDGKMSVPEAINCIGQLAEAVSYIHDQHILHRDIKPDNVMITPDNRIVLVDFGSAREFVNDEVQNHTAILTHGYAPIEQYATKGKKGNYTDIYAMGGVFYFALTGEKPMDAADRTMMQMKSPKELVSSVPDEINNTIMKAMEMKPEDRYQTVREFMVDLVGEQVASGQTEVLNVPQGGKSGKSKALIGVLVVLVILLGAGIAYFMYEKQKEDKAEIEKFAEQYNEKVNRCDMLISNIVRDRYGNEGNKEFFIQALMTLQEIEKMEQDPIFQNSGITPVFEQKFNLYRAELEKAETLVEKKYRRYVADDLSETKSCKEVKERLDLIRDILQQSEKKSAVGILPKSSMKYNQ